MKKGPQAVRDILPELMARCGFARVLGAEALAAAWREAAGPLLAEHTRVGQVRGGRLEVLVSNSTLVQELTYMKADLIVKLAAAVPDEKIKDLKFRVGSL